LHEQNQGTSLLCAVFILGVGGTECVCVTEEREISSGDMMKKNSLGKIGRKDLEYRHFFFSPELEIKPKALCGCPAHYH
jgi:hypothetical protein